MNDKISLKSIFDNIPTEYLFYDDDLKILFANERKFKSVNDEELLIDTYFVSLPVSGNLKENYNVLLLVDFVRWNPIGGKFLETFGVVGIFLVDKKSKKVYFKLIDEECSEFFSVLFSHKDGYKVEDIRKESDGYVLSVVRSNSDENIAFIPKSESARIESICELKVNETVFEK